jgi:predicted permease
VVVVGILPPGASWGQADLFIPLRVTPEEQTPQTNWINLVGRLRPGGTLDQARADLAAMSARLAPEDNPGHVVTAVPEDFRTFWFGSSREAQRFLELAALFVLALAGLNVAALLLGRGTARSAELGLREALGARPFQIYQPLLTEALVAAIPGIVLAFFFARWTQNLLEAFVPGDLQDFHRTGWTEFGFSALLALVLIALCAALPTLLLSRAAPSGMAGRSTSGPRRRWLRHGIVVLQTSCALALLSGFALVFTSLRQLRNSPAGFDGRRCIVARVDLDIAGEADESRAAGEIRSVLEHLEGLPGVASANATNFVPALNNGWNGTVDVPGLAKPAFTWLRTATPGYFHAMGIPLRAGRTFLPSDLSGSPASVIVSESFARDYLPGRDPIGAVIQREGSLRIVGVVGDVALRLGKTSDRQTLYLPQFLFGDHVDLVVEAKGPMEPLIPLVRGVLRKAWPDLPLRRVEPMPRLIEATMEGSAQWAQLQGLLAGLALIITAAGIFGVLSRDVMERRRELGVRMALGATREALAFLVLRQAMAVVGLGFLVGLGGSAGMACLLRNQIGGVPANDPSSHLLAAALLLTTALLASLIPALRAARVQPADALRNE